MIKSVTRRRLVAGAGASVALGLLPSVTRAQAARLRCFWWGNPERDRRTKAVLDNYSKKTGVPISGEALGWGDYWTKLGTQTAGGNAPDLFQMDYRYLFEYGRRDTLLALDKLLPLPDFNAADRNSGMVDGKLNGIGLGVNAKAVLYDVAVLEKVGVKTIDPAWTWADFAKILGEISKLRPGKYWGSSDNSRWEQGFEQWLNQQGKQLYTADGKVAFTRDDVAAWFDMWDKLRKAGAIPPADVGAIATGNVPDFEISRGLAAIGFANSNQLIAYQTLNKNKLALATFPRDKGGSSGLYVKPAIMMCISARTKDPVESAKLVNYIVTDPEAVKILGIERGVPCSAAARALMATEADEAGRAQIDFMAALGKMSIPLPPPPPKGAGEVENLLRRVAESVAFGKVSIKDGAQQFHAEVESTLARS